MSVTARRLTAGWTVESTDRPRPLYLPFPAVRVLAELAEHGSLPSGATTRPGGRVGRGSVDKLARADLAARDPDSPRWTLTSRGRAVHEAIVGASR